MIKAGGRRGKGGDKTNTAELGHCTAGRMQGEDEII